MLLLLCAAGMAAEEKSQDLVYLLHSNTLSFDEERLKDAQILRGNVIFRHDSALMYCDSAYFFDKANSLYAFSNVRFVQGDTLTGYGDALYYDGNTKIARMRRHVKLVHHSTVLTTDSLNYDRTRDLAYYFTGGKIVDSLNTLTSVWGQYHPPTNQALFRRNVELVNDKFTLSSDTLKYNTESHIADIVGPTKIVYEKETTILSTSGQYNTENEQSMLFKRSRVIHEDGKQMTGDTIYYDKQIGFGRVWGNFEMKDTVQQATLYGNYGQMYEEDGRGYATDSALMVDWSDPEDYGYIHADTLFTEDVHYILGDSATGIDTTYRQVRAHYNVRVYRTDVQSVCDSMVYNNRDSIMTLYRDPVCWNENSQISADVIDIYMKDGEVDHAHGTGAALVVKQETDEYFDQLSGKEMTAYITDGVLTQVDVSGNAETIFYPREEDSGDYFGMNRTKSSYVKIYFTEEQVDHALFTTETTGTIYPLDQIPAGQDRLSSFFWATVERPLKPGDVFEHPERTPRPVGAPISATGGDTEQKEEKAEEQQKQPTINRSAGRVKRKQQ